MKKKAKMFQEKNFKIYFLEDNFFFYEKESENVSRKEF